MSKRTKECEYEEQHRGIHCGEIPQGEIQREILRRLLPSERWEQARNMYWSARELRAAVLRTQHPDWENSRIEAEVRRIFSDAAD